LLKTKEPPCGGSSSSVPPGRFEFHPPMGAPALRFDTNILIRLM